MSYRKCKITDAIWALLDSNNTDNVNADDFKRVVKDEVNWNEVIYFMDIYGVCGIGCALSIYLYSPLSFFLTCGLHFMQGGNCCYVRTGKTTLCTPLPMAPAGVAPVVRPLFGRCSKVLSRAHVSARCIPLQILGYCSNLRLSHGRYGR